MAGIALACWSRLEMQALSVNVKRSATKLSKELKESAIVVSLSQQKINNTKL